jgi:hypothetical protein
VPYRRESASKGGHSDLVRNPDVAGFLRSCQYIREPTDAEASAVAGTFGLAPVGAAALPIQLAASDASIYSEPINGKFPSTQIGYVKVSIVLIDLSHFAALSAPGSRYVDPFKVAAMHRNADGVAFTLPGSNVRYGGAMTVRDGFRRAVFDQFSDHRTNFDSNGHYRVIDTLLLLSRDHPLLRCPVCRAHFPEPVTFAREQLTSSCAACHADLYASDVLSLHEELSDFGDNASVITRFMNVAEHLMVASLVRMLADRLPDTLARMGFIIDGPLALFGRPAWVHKPLMALYHDIGEDLRRRGLAPPAIMGLQKDGQVMEHARAVQRYLKPNTFRVVDDEYRERWITGSPSEAATHGSETYYGQDFIFKSQHGGVFCVGLPYPMRVKGNERMFAAEKAQVARYGDQLGRALDLVRHFEFDLYENSVIPVALAHRHASISLVPGGKVLDLLTRAGLRT